MTSNQIDSKPIDRVKRIIEDKGLSVSAFEREIGMSNNSIQQAIKRNANLKDDTLINILKRYPEYSAEWLLTGTGSLYRGEKETDYKKEGEFTAAGFIQKEIITQLDEFSKKDLVVYLELRKDEFKEIPEFHSFKELLIKDDLIIELIKRLGSNS